MTLPVKRAIKNLQTDVSGLTVDLSTFGITDLANVTITDLTNGQILKYNSGSSIWVNAADAT